MGQYTQINKLDDLMDGQITERFNVELRRVMENCYDPNTDPTAKRSINIQFEIQPNQDRTSAQFKAKVTSKIAGYVPVAKSILIDVDDDGTVIATEKTNQVPGQMDMEGKTHIPKMVMFNNEKGGEQDAEGNAVAADGWKN